jgi:hypothetical protein
MAKPVPVRFGDRAAGRPFPVSLLESAAILKFMSGLFEIENLARRLKAYVAVKGLKPQTLPILEEALVRGEVERGAVDRITGLPERSARRVLNDAIQAGLLASASPGLGFAAGQRLVWRRIGVSVAPSLARALVIACTQSV